eukprot:CAMPEP_0113713116 /NCGR_PEP_ID=MMETSP0038_2-20120614/31801_1 /TAXON_ID=2898 /ORGANISM="Cryptomonas paramecium" /LENGTH=204 /DNA_ID=CAMNT_0000639783 /DNA_START=116 /DNA_END=726 /DNA_ORIENTATION=+ /assembly_acc=CAM_ASM_000170
MPMQCFSNSAEEALRSVGQFDSAGNVIKTDPKQIGNEIEQPSLLHSYASRLSGPDANERVSILKQGQALDPFVSQETLSHCTTYPKFNRVEAVELENMSDLQAASKDGFMNGLDVLVIAAALIERDSSSSTSTAHSPSSNAVTPSSSLAIFADILPSASIDTSRALPVGPVVAPHPAAAAPRALRATADLPDGAGNGDGDGKCG